MPLILLILLVILLVVLFVPLIGPVLFVLTGAGAYTAYTLFQPPYVWFMIGIVVTAVIIWIVWTIRREAKIDEARIKREKEYRRQKDPKEDD